MWKRSRGLPAAAFAALLLLSACQSGDDQGEATDLTDFATRYAAAWSSQDPAALASFYAENGSLRVNDGEPSTGREAVAATAQAFMAAFPDMVVRLVELRRDGDYVEFHWHWTGTNTGPGGTGNAVDLRGYERWTLDDDGLILESDGHYDEAEYQRQLNAPQDETASRDAAQDDKPFLLTYPNLEDPDGEVLLTNDHVVVQRFVVGPGEWEGIHSHPGNQIYVHVKGGEWSGRLGGKVEYSGEVSPDGEVGWMEAIPLSAGHESGNTGDTPIDLIWVTLKDDVPIASELEPVPQVYPNVNLEPVLENDRMIVQRAQIEPGQWTGVHSHPGNQVYIHLSGGNWSERRGDTQSATSPFVEAGSVGWWDASAGDTHDAGNTGDTRIDLVLVTLR